MIATKNNFEVPNQNISAPHPESDHTDEDLTHYDGMMTGCILNHCMLGYPKIWEREPIQTSQLHFQE